MGILKSKLLSLVQSNHFFDDLTEYLGIPMQKFNDGIEYEIKLNYISSLSVVELNRKISDILEDCGYFSNRCEKQTDYTVNFLQSPLYDREISVFLYEEEPLMKIKKHVINEYREFAIFKSEESFEYNKQKIAKVVTASNTRYLGCMQKIRCKDFIVDCANGMIFASAVTQCIVASGERSQYQYEIEYYGHYNINEIDINEAFIYKELVKIAQILSNRMDVSFFNSRETKFDFAVNPDNSAFDMTDDFNKLLQILK